MDRHTKNKELISALRMAMYDFSESSVRKVLDRLFISETVLRLCYPLGEKVGVDNFYMNVFAPLLKMGLCFRFPIKTKVIDIIFETVKSPPDKRTLNFFCSE